MNLAGSSANGVEVAGLAKRYGDAAAIERIDLAVAPGEFVALLGPSGCGKTTLLRAIAGLIKPDSGRVRIGERLVVDMSARILMPPEQRHLGMVFQDYALWPHMRVRENVAFPLEARGVPAARRPELVGAALARVGLVELGERFPGELSGGQQQRVALARAIVDGPGLLLFDEPLSNLDASLREALGREIARLVRELGATSLYVTHDQAEALGLADRVAVMRAGRILAFDTPEQLYRHPPSAWIAAFLRAGNLIQGQARDGVFLPTGTNDTLALPALINGHSGPSTLLLPPGAIRFDAAGPAFSLAVESVQFKGEQYELTARWGQAPDAPLLRFSHDRALRAGEQVPVALDLERLRFFREDGADSDAA